MLNYFRAGPDLVRWELTTLGHTRTYRLTIHHALGTIVEYFDDVAVALLRQSELEELLIAARSTGPLEPAWVDVPIKTQKNA